MKRWLFMPSGRINHVHNWAFITGASLRQHQHIRSQSLRRAVHQITYHPQAPAMLARVTQLATNSVFTIDSVILHCGSGKGFLIPARWSFEQQGCKTGTRDWDWYGYNKVAKTLLHNVCTAPALRFSMVHVKGVQGVYQSTIFYSNVAYIENDVLFN